MLHSWQRREKLMQRAQQNVAAFYGDLQGIAGRQLRDLPALALEERSSEALPEASDHDDRLCEILFSLLPEDGTGAGNGTLFESFREKALTEVNVLATLEDYERIEARLLERELVRRGKGKGGSLCRGRVADIEQAVDG